MNEHNDLAALIRADTPLLAIDTHEELEVIAAFQRALGSSLRPLYAWSITTGLKRLDMEAEPEPMSSGEVLDAIRDTRQKSVFLLLDYTPFLRYVVTLRQLREIAIRQWHRRAHGGPGRCQPGAAQGDRGARCALSVQPAA